MNPESDPASPLAWLARAKGNLRLAQEGQHIEGVFKEDLCFHAQQAAEKAFKAICLLHEQDFPKTHSLVNLIDILESAGVVVPDEIRRADILTQYAVQTRYPGVSEPILYEEYIEALSMAEAVIVWAESLISNKGEDHPE